MHYFSIKSLYLELKWRFLFNKLREIDLLILDVDGVLTDGGLWFKSDGEILKRFDVKDGLGLNLLQEIGIEIVLISGGESFSAKARASQLGIKYCFFGVRNKYDKLRDFQKEKSFPIAKCAYVGDDINDIVVRPLVSLLFTPSNASKSLISISDFTLQNSGGFGAIRELTEKILISKGLWKNYFKNGWVKGIK
tara:strand:+ start:1363 stop:1941 length:579 start_codon:yes stop_codon:yes gene_type:complete